MSHSFSAVSLATRWGVGWEMSKREKGGVDISRSSRERTLKRGNLRNGACTLNTIT